MILGLYFVQRSMPGRRSMRLTTVGCERPKNSRPRPGPALAEKWATIDGSGVPASAHVWPIRATNSATASSGDTCETTGASSLSEAISRNSGESAELDDSTTLQVY
jgi:hypothetical protein